ncbi:uncharacterized protein VTP21DRAFT_7033 [Calcarisporiella thermophila]|uniref:uncharacterized protein n=1 Tax=Calcarisporiella thermophila TaxID=911321 RepID=UPI003744A1AC
MSVLSPTEIDEFARVYDGEPADWDRLLSGYRSCVDWPTTSFYEELIRQNPKAKVILTVRDSPLLWYQSVISTIFYFTLRPFPYKYIYPWMYYHYYEGRFGLMPYHINQHDFGGRVGDQQFAISMYNERMQKVKQLVPPEQLLIFNVKQGWEPLCKFLGVPVPDQPFPHDNERAILQSRNRRMKRCMDIFIIGTLACSLVAMWCVSKQILWVH